MNQMAFIALTAGHCRYDNYQKAPGCRTDAHVRLAGNSKLSVSVNVDVCLSLCLGPAIN